MLRILSLGAGVQSSAVLLMSCRGVLPKLDHAIFADTQWEPPEVYDQLAFLTREAEAAGIPVHVVTAGNLREHVLDAAEGRAKRCSKPPLYVRGDDGRQQILQRDCSRDFKVRVIERKAKELAGLKPGATRPREVVVEQWLGISADEVQRMKVSTESWLRIWHPLIEGPYPEGLDPIEPLPEPDRSEVDAFAAKLRAALGDDYEVADPVLLHDPRTPKRAHAPLRDQALTRDDCVRWMAENGYPPAPKSACIGCPYHSDAAWRALRQRPDLWADVCDFDRRARTIPGVRGEGGAFLHRSLVPLAEAPIDRDEPGQQALECSGGCFL